MSYGSWLIIGRTVGAAGGAEYRWRADDNDEVPGESDKTLLIACMRRDHTTVFAGDVATQAEVVALPAWSDEKLWKHPQWRLDLQMGGAQEGRYGIHVNDEGGV